MSSNTTHMNSPTITEGASSLRSIAPRKLSSAKAVGTRGKTVRAALALSNARYRLWAGAVATAIGALILTAAVGTWRVPWLWNPPLAPHLSIVVLPFANLGGDPDQQYFADGITEDVTVTAVLYLLSREFLSSERLFSQIQKDRRAT
jgi:hypothetical protein